MQDTRAHPTYADAGERLRSRTEHEVAARAKRRMAERTRDSVLELAAAFGPDWTFGIPLLSRPGMPRTNIDGRDLQSRGARGREAPHQARGTCASLPIIAEPRAYSYRIQRAIEIQRNGTIAL
jgi:hypothetical protein